MDRLLASAHYGERMALPWLDAARYADSNGFQQDRDTFQWVWRDWVVQALNANMPFDQFTIEQLAGDLIPGATREQQLATAFHRNGLLNGEGGNIPEEQRHVLLFDRVDVTATNWMGLTVACAQCHDHKYDPIKQKDYYALMAAFNNVPENGTAGDVTKIIGSANPLLDMASAEQRAQKKDLLQGFIAARDALEKARGEWQKRIISGEEICNDAEILALIRRPPQVNPSEQEKKTLNDEQNQIKRYFDDKVAKKLKDLPKEKFDKAEKQLHQLLNQYPVVMVMSDAQPRETHILDRGNYQAPKATVGVDVPGFLPPLPADAPRNRLGIARWLVAKDQPLTARVTVNRLWQNFYGMGLIKTAEDFGVQGEAPLHGELLDWLAVEFRDSGWNVKRIQRLIVTSATYRQVSRVTPALLERDPENRLLARAPRFRLPSPLIRDQALAASGLLDRRIGGRPVYPYQPQDIWGSLAVTKERDFTYPQSIGPDLYRRSLYTFWRRTVAPANMFDSSPRQTCKVRSTNTSTPLDALTTLNDPTFVEAGRVLATRVMTEKPEQRLALAFRHVLSRWPDATERELLARSLNKHLTRFQTDPKAAVAYLAVGEAKYDSALDPSQLAAYAAVCLGIFNLDEALCRQ